MSVLETIHELRALWAGVDVANKVFTYMLIIGGAITFIMTYIGFTPERRAVSKNFKIMWLSKR